MSTRVALEEGARITPVGLGWATILGADPATQVGLVAGILTCLYMLGQLWWIWRRSRIENEKLSMVRRQHLADMARREVDNDRDDDAAGGAS